MKTIIALLSVSLISAVLIAQTPDEAIRFMNNEDGVGVKAMSMGNAFVSAADDYSAVYWNPAALTLLKQSELSGSFYHTLFQNESSFAGNTLMENETFTRFKSMGMAYKFPTVRGSMVFALGYQRFKDFDDFLYFQGFDSLGSGLEFELEDDAGNPGYYAFDTGAMQTEQIMQRGNLGAWTAGIGIAMSPNFSMGAAVNIYSGSHEYAFDFYQDDVDDLYNTFPANFDSYELYQTVHSKFSGFGIKLGGLIELNRDIRLGMAVDLPTRLKVVETWAANDVIYFDDDFVSEMDLGEGEWQYIIKYPMKLSGGVSLDLDRFVLAGGFEYRDWSQVEFDIPSGFDRDGDYNDLLAENPIFKNDYRPVFSYSAGAQFRVPGTGLSLRGGYRVVPSPYVDADKTLDRQYISGGFGYDLDRNTTLNVGYIRGLWERESFDGYTPSGTFEAIETHRFLAGLTYRF